MNIFAKVLPDAFHILSLNASVFVFIIGIMMFFGSVGGWLFQKLKIPQVVGYIVIGILIGSSGFQILGNDTIVNLNPVSSVALSLIGFLVGAELKIDVIKKYGKQFIGILVGESLMPFVVVGILVTGVSYLFTKDLNQAISLGLLLGAISAATAPAATTDVLKEYRTRGPLTTTILGIVAMDDAFALILYAVASSIVAPLLGGTSVSFGMQMIGIAKDIFGSIALGMVVGLLLSFLLRFSMENNGRILGFSLGCLFLSTGICDLLNLDHILAAMSIGFFMANFAPGKTRAMFKLVEKFTPPVYVLFFVVVGAKLNVWIVTPFIGLIAILYVIGRTVGKSIGSTLGAKLTNAPETVRKYLPFCLLSQAGVAIGLSIAAGNDFSDSIGPQIMLIITATTFIVQLLGPVCVKYGVQKAGEIGLDITEEDIMMKTKVCEVTDSLKNPVCDENSAAIVNETDTIGKIMRSFSTHDNLNYEVKNADGKLCGIISLKHLKETLQIGDFADFMLAVDVMERSTVNCSKDTALPEAYKLFAEHDTDCLCIVDKDNRPMGILEKYTVDHYLHLQIVQLEHKLENLG